MGASIHATHAPSSHVSRLSPKLSVDENPSDGAVAPRANEPCDGSHPGRREPTPEVRIDLRKGLEETLRPVMEAVERRYLEALLEETRGRIQQAARIARISRRTLQRKLAAHQIDKADYRRPPDSENRPETAPHDLDPSTPRPTTNRTSIARASGS